MGPPGSDVPGRGTAAAQGGRLVHDDGALQIWRAATPPGLIIAGEIDEVSYPALLRQLAALAKVHVDVHVAMADVVYCDLAGLRAIVSLAGPGGDGRGQSRRVVLHELPAHLLAALRIVGWDTTPGLVIAQ